MIRRIVAVGATLVLVACGGSSTDEPTTAVPSTTATTSTPAATPTQSPYGTALITPPPDEALRTGCPVDDLAICDLALGVEAALNGGDAGFIADRAVAESRPCRNVFWAAMDDIGCATETDMTIPVISLLYYQSDCCVVAAELFEQRLQAWLDERDSAVAWRLVGIEVGDTAWNHQPGIILVRGNGEQAPLITVGVTEDRSRIAGVIVGSLWSLFIFPDAELLPWP
jgi:hypothetical protein